VSRDVDSANALLLCIT